MKFKLIKSVPVKADIRSFIFEPDTPLTWQPGQYFHYVLDHADADDRGNERWFTNSAAPSERFVMISTRISEVNGSSFKRALVALKPGDLIEADGPEGDFTLGDSKRNYLFIAGGIGITPFRSMLKEADTKGNKLNVDLLYANRTSEIAFSDEFNQFAINNPNLKIEYIIQPDQINQGLLNQKLNKINDPLIYVSGPEAMVKSLAEQLLQLGLGKDSIKTDDFPGYSGV